MNPVDRYYIEHWGINAYVEHRLYHWAKWFNQRDDHGLGYPSRSLAFLLQQGGAISNDRGPRPLPCNPAAEELEKIIGILRQTEPRITQALCQEYLDNRDQATKAKQVGVSPAQFKIDTALARYWLRGWFHSYLIQNGQVQSLDKK